MPYDREHLRLQWLFQDMSSDEIALTGVNYSNVPNWNGAQQALSDLDVVGSDGDDLTNHMGDLMGLADLRWADYSQLIGIKVSAIGTNGKLLSDPKIHVALPPIQGVTANTSPQQTIVCSLRSGTSLGTANFGRMFLPHTRFNFSVGSSVANPSATFLTVAAFKTFLNACTSTVRAAGADTIQPFIMSNFDPVRPSKPVTRVRVGNVVDTQRRRRNQLNEVYSDLVL